MSPNFLRHLHGFLMLCQTLKGSVCLAPEGSSPLGHCIVTYLLISPRSPSYLRDTCSFPGDQNSADATLLSTFSADGRLNCGCFFSNLAESSQFFTNMPDGLILVGLHVKFVDFSTRKLLPLKVKVHLFASDYSHSPHRLGVAREISSWRNCELVRKWEWKARLKRMGWAEKAT